MARPSRTLGLILALLALTLCGRSFAEIPFMVSYQGRVADASGNAVPDGNYTMRFRIYNDPTAWSPLWDSGDRTVAVSGGVFSVVLGESPQPPLDLPFNADYWLQVTFQGVDQSPRQRLTSVGYAYMASGLVPGTEVAGPVTDGTFSAIKCTNTATTGLAYGVFGEGRTAGGHFQTNSDEGGGVNAWATASSGETYGLHAWSQSTSGTGVYAVVSASSGSTIGVYGRSNSVSGKGLYGEAASSTGVTYGAYGRTYSASGVGVYGYASATTAGTSYGVYGRAASGSGVGVYGWADATTGSAHGVYGVAHSSTGHGVHGLNSQGVGVYGEGTNAVVGLSNTPGYGAVYGRNTATTGTGMGVYGRTDSSTGFGVSGYASSTLSGLSSGVYGETNGTSGNNAGVRGYASRTSGVAVGGSFEAASSSGRAVDAYGGYYAGRFETPYFAGVLAYATASSGFTYGVRGISDSSAGRGVLGSATATTGVTYGVYGMDQSPSGYGVYYSGGLGGTGVMRTIVRTSRGPTGLDAVTAAGNWVEDFGEGRLVNGTCHVQLDPLFLETVTIDDANPMKVFVTPTEDFGSWWVRKDEDGFTLHAPRAPDGAVFDYRVVAKRKGFERKRLEYCAAAEDDPYLFPELREKERRELEEERSKSEQERARWHEEHLRQRPELTRMDEDLARMAGQGPREEPLGESTGPASVGTVSGEEEAVARVPAGKTPPR